MRFDMEKRGMTQELPELEKGAHLSYESSLKLENYDEDDMDKFIIKATEELKSEKDSSTQGCIRKPKVYTLD